MFHKLCSSCWRLVDDGIEGVLAGALGLGGAGRGWREWCCVMSSDGGEDPLLLVLVKNTKKISAVLKGRLHHQ